MITDLLNNYAPVQAPPRRHLGPSQLAHKCDRNLWYSYHKPEHSETFPPRILRIFDRGNREEQVFVNMLMSLGIKYKKHPQIDFGGGVKGTPDGVLPEGLSKIIDDPIGNPILVEFKTHNDKNFRALTRLKHVREAHYGHWLQMQCYMYGTLMSACLYLAVNKNDDEIYSELVYVNAVAASAAIQRAQAIIAQHAVNDIPKIHNNSTFYICKMCRFRRQCYLDDYHDIEIIIHDKQYDSLHKAT